jgi:hypothetical protein
MSITHADASANILTHLPQTIPIRDRIPVSSLHPDFLYADRLFRREL